MSAWYLPVIDTMELSQDSFTPPVGGAGDFWAWHRHAFNLCWTHCPTHSWFPAAIVCYHLFLTRTGCSGNILGNILLGCISASALWRTSRIQHDSYDSRCREHHLGTVVFAPCIIIATLFDPIVEVTSQLFLWA